MIYSELFGTCHACCTDLANSIAYVRRGRTPLYTLAYTLNPVTPCNYLSPLGRNEQVSLQHSETLTQRHLESLVVKFKKQQQCTRYLRRWGWRRSKSRSDTEPGRGRGEKKSHNTEEHVLWQERPCH